MMIKPTLDELLAKVDTKYTLVILSSKIAREITSEYLDKGATLTANPVSMALTEIADGHYGWEKQEPVSDYE